MTREVFTKELLLDFKARGLTLTDISNEIYGHPENYRNIRRAYKRHQIEPYRIPVLKPTQEKLEELIIERGMTPRMVAEELGYGPNGWSNIYAYCREYGITDFDFSPNADIKRKRLDGDIAAIVHGTLLGDGSINHKGALIMTHGERQLEYLKWKQSRLSWLCFENIRKRDSDQTPPFSCLPTYTVRSHVHPYLKELRRKCWISGQKAVAPIIDSQFFNALSLAVWYLDDGSLNSKYGTVTFATNGFTRGDVNILIDRLAQRFNLEAKLEERRNDTFAIRINKSKTRLFFDIIQGVMPEPPESMCYKLPSQ